MTLSLQRSSLHLIKVERDTVTGSSATVPCEADGYIGCIKYIRTSTSIPARAVNMHSLRLETFSASPALEHFFGSYGSQVAITAMEARKR